MRWKFILGLLTTCAVLMSMSYTMLIPFLPMYLIQAVSYTHLTLPTIA